MKKYLFGFILLLSFYGNNYAQLKLGYVDSDAIISQLPDAKDAQKKIDRIIQDWQEELSKMESTLKNSTREFENQKLIMSNQKRKETEKQLKAKEKEISDFRQKKFGVNGELFQKQEELMKPIQNMIFNAIEEVAKEKDLDFVFDKSGDLMFLYAKDKYDITSLVLEKLK